jgi:hypothetical protein
MRQYLIDEITFLERDNIDNYLKRSLKQGPIERVFWLEIPPDLYGPEQQGHEGCGPFYFSVILEDKTLRCEFLVRSSHNMRCTCTAWATPAQRQFALDYIDRLLAEEMIRA